MEDEHPEFKVRMAFVHCAEGPIKADCTDLRCRICTEPFDNLQAFAQHLNFYHGKRIVLDNDLGIQPFNIRKDRFLCAICNAKSLCLRQLSRHTQTHFLKYTCEACGKSYTTVTSLKNHVRFSHIQDGKARICRKCKMTFSSLEAKRAHLKGSRKCWPHKCMVCGERFITYGLKQAHLNKVHDMKGRTYDCPECGQSFSNRKHYRVHFRLNHTDDNFICSSCGLKFETQRNLDEHRVVHTKEKLFPCTVCSKSFPRKKNLAQHMWIHNEHKRFECTMCNKQFNQRVSWRLHMKTYHPEVHIPPYKSTSTFEEGRKYNVQVTVSVMKDD